MGNWYEKSFGSDYLRVYKHRDEKSAEVEVKIITKWLGIGAEDRILDLCCGAGRHSIALARKGYNVVGIDLSDELLRSAQEKAGNMHVTFVLGDMRKLPFPSGSFDVVMNVFTSFGYFAEDAENETVLREMARVLSSSGRFLIDVMNPKRTRENLVPFSTRELHGTEIKEERSIFDQTVRKEVTLLDEEGERKYVEQVRMYDKEELTVMLLRSGLQVDAMYGDYNGNVFHKDSERMILKGKAVIK